MKASETLFQAQADDWISAAEHAGLIVDQKSEHHFHVHVISSGVLLNYYPGTQTLYSKLTGTVRGVDGARLVQIASQYAE